MKKKEACTMLKNLVSISAALILAAATFSAPAYAQKGHGGGHLGGGGGAHFSGGGAHFGGARMGGAGLKSGGFAYRGAGLPSRGYAYRGIGAGRYAYASGPRGYRYGHGYGHRGQWYGHRYGHRYPGYGYGYPVYGYGDYWPYWGWGLAAAALASADYGYYDAYGDDSGVAYCIQRFKSYHLPSRTYLGYDGRRHSCP